MRKASKILYLIAGIVGIIGFVGLLIGGISMLVLGITAMNPDVAAEVAGQSQGQITQEQAIAAGAVLVGTGVFMTIASVLSLVSAIIALRARAGKAKSLVALIFGAIGTVAFGIGAFCLLGGIFGLVADKQGQPA